MYQIPKQNFDMIMDQLARARQMTENAMRLLELYKKEEKEKTDPDAYLKRCCMRECPRSEKRENKSDLDRDPSMEEMMENEQHFYQSTKKYKY